MCVILKHFENFKDDPYVYVSIPYAYVSHFLKSYWMGAKLHRLVPHEETSFSMYLVLELDAWFGWKTRKCLVDTYAYVSLTHTRMCQVH